MREQGELGMRKDKDEDLRKDKDEEGGGENKDGEERKRMRKGGE